MNTTLLHPELVRPIPFIGQQAERLLGSRAAQSATDDPSLDPQFSVVIHANLGPELLPRFLQDLEQQVVGSRPEVILVNGDSPQCVQAGRMARALGITVVENKHEYRPPDYKYSDLMNKGMEAASNPIVFHARVSSLFSNVLALHAGVRHMANGDVGGVCSGVFPLPESPARAWLGATSAAADLYQGSRILRNARLGAMSIVGSFFSRPAWKDLGKFKEQYALGPDARMAASMIAAGLVVVREPAMVMHGERI